MPISLAAAQNHVEVWSAQLANYAPRKGWPKRLFHACQVEVAAKIIETGEIRCRNQAGPIICDVANQGALWNNPVAHDYVRLYFRPRNSFHLKTEGIKRIGDRYRRDPHMSIPIMFAFSFVSVLTSEHARFLPVNFAHTGGQPLDGDKKFAALDFQKIYHDGPTNEMNRAEILDARMAEVVIGQPLSLAYLDAVVCRTSYEAETLRAHLPAHVAMPRTIIEQNGSIFMRREIFVKELFTSGGHIHVWLNNGSSGGQNLQYRLLSVERDVSGTLPSPKVMFNSFRVDDPSTIWTFEVEGCLAFRGRIPASAGIV